MYWHHYRARHSTSRAVWYILRFKPESIDSCIMCACSTNNICTPATHILYNSAIEIKPFPVPFIYSFIQNLIWKQYQNQQNVVLPLILHSIVPGLTKWLHNGQFVCLYTHCTWAAFSHTNREARLNQFLCISEEFKLTYAASITPARHSKIRTTNNKGKRQ